MRHNKVYLMRRVELAHYPKESVSFKTDYYLSYKKTIREPDSVKIQEDGYKSVNSGGSIVVSEIDFETAKSLVKAGVLTISCLSEFEKVDAPIKHSITFALAKDFLEDYDRYYEEGSELSDPATITVKTNHLSKGELLHSCVEPIRKIIKVFVDSLVPYVEETGKDKEYLSLSIEKLKQSGLSTFFNDLYYQDSGRDLFDYDDGKCFHDISIVDMAVITEIDKDKLINILRRIHDFDSIDSLNANCNCNCTCDACHICNPQCGGHCI